MTRKTVTKSKEPPSSYNSKKTKKATSNYKEAIKFDDKQSKSYVLGDDCRNKSSLIDKNLNFVHKLLNTQQGSVATYNSDQSVQNVLMGMASRLHPYKTASPFDRRVTSLAWHPTRARILAAGSKGGEILWWNVNENNNEQLFQHIPGLGPGGSITSMHFHREKPTFIYTASVAGKVMLQDFEGKHSNCFLDTNTWENWFSSLDIEPHKNLLAAGDTKGYLYLTSSKDGKMVWQSPKQIHKGKVSRVQFHPLQSDLLVSSSIDHTVKLWDMRKIDSMKDCLGTSHHSKGVNSATFNPSSGNLILTTDQHNELRILSGPSWESQITISHPHRQFQHLTPIKASWHPCMDVVVVGRYPDENFQKNDKRTIDFFDGHSGKLQFQLLDSSLSGIVSLNQFNSTGDVLASGMGFHVIVWKPKDEDEEVLSKRNGLKMPSVNKKTEKTTSAFVKSRNKSKITVPQKKIKLR